MKSFSRCKTDSRGCCSAPIVKKQIFIIFALIGRRAQRAAGPHIYVMHPTQQNLPFLFDLLVFTNPIVNHTSKVKKRRKSNPKLVQRFPTYAAFKSSSYGKVALISQTMALNPRFVGKKQGSAGIGYIT